MLNPGIVDAIKKGVKQIPFTGSFARKATPSVVAQMNLGNAVANALKTIGSALRKVF
jgi:hypothetical protein